MTFIATAEHTQGKSVCHPCNKGIWSDPTDDFESIIDVDSYEAAEAKATDRLKKVVSEARTCDCRRALQAGSDAWWNSVAISLAPQDDEAREADRRHFV